MKLKNDVQVLTDLTNTLHKLVKYLEKMETEKKEYKRQLLNTSNNKSLEYLILQEKAALLERYTDQLKEIIKY